MASGRRSLSIVLICLGISLSAAGEVAAVDCPTVSRPVCQCGDTVIADYTMSDHLRNASSVAQCLTGDGLTVASGVTLNCEGFGITGNFDANGIVNKYGIVIKKADDVNIIACNISDFYTGVRLTDSRDVRFEDVSALNNGHYGIEVTDTNDSPATYTQRVSIVASDITGNGDEGIHMSTALGLSPAPPVANHSIIGNSVIDNGCEGIYVLRINGSSNANVGVRVFSNSVYGNDSACAASGSHAGIYVKTSSYNRFRYNSLTHDFMHITDSSNNNKILSTVINHSFMKIDANSSSNALTQVCVLGDTVTPSNSFQIKTGANNNTCGSCAAYRPSADHIDAVGSSGNTFTNLRINTVSPLIAAGSGVSVTTSTNPLSCLN